MADVQGDLNRLVETERQLDLELAEARALGARLVADARSGIAAREEGLAGEVRDAIGRERAAIERQLDERLASIDAEAQRAALAFDGVTPGTLQGLARQLVARLVGAAP